MSFDKVIKLCKGPGNGVDTACLVTASNMLMGKGGLGDAITCQCPIIAGFIIPTNDYMPDDLRARLYGPLVYEIIGTRTDDLVIEKKRFEALFDWCCSQVYLDGSSERIRLLASLDKSVQGLDLRREIVSWGPHAEVLGTWVGSWAGYMPGIWERCPEIILEMAAIGDRRPVETVISVDRLSEILNA